MKSAIGAAVMNCPSSDFLLAVVFLAIPSRRRSKAFVRADDVDACDLSALSIRVILPPRTNPCHLGTRELTQPVRSHLNFLGSIHLQQQPLEIFTFGEGQVHRMVGGAVQLLDDAR